MHFLANLIEYVFSSKKTLIYTTFSKKEYYLIVSKLKAVSVKYRVASTADFSSAPGGSYSDLGNEYKFYVAKQDEGKALEAIHHKSK
ncbi:hypothetical protein [Pontibacillus yanchengensis]|uniref:DUF2007 domain-containing protein n=1 Tax=Pontibacillus yanchengensis Y32 TaxID=1385514 RepID=A0A0A2TFU6_9BACI|nr:hypothetical protein [Pontibacillus yanchengensis]KGP73308.1 hypothetical protein N782_06535 [Pontibacillus yanchengensis Y32]